MISHTHLNAMSQLSLLSEISSNDEKCQIHKCIIKTRSLKYDTYLKHQIITKSAHCKQCILVQNGCINDKAFCLCLLWQEIKSLISIFIAIIKI